VARRGAIGGARLVGVKAKRPMGLRGGVEGVLLSECPGKEPETWDCISCACVHMWVGM